MSNVSNNARITPTLKYRDFFPYHCSWETAVFLICLWQTALLERTSMWVRTRSWLTVWTSWWQHTTRHPLPSPAAPICWQHTPMCRPSSVTSWITTGRNTRWAAFHVYTGPLWSVGIVVIVVVVLQQFPISPKHCVTHGKEPGMWECQKDLLTLQVD